MADQDNPYEAGTHPTIGTGRRRSVGLVILGTVVGAVGVLAIIGNIALFIYRLNSADQVPWAQVPWAFKFWELELRLVAILTGVVLVTAGFFIARGYWKCGLALALFAFMVALLNPGVNEALRHHFAGDSYRIGPPPTANDAVEDLLRDMR